MTTATVPALAPIIPFRPKRGRPSKQDESTLELAMRRSEEQAMVAQVMPAIRRLEMVVREHGPEAWHQWAVVAHELTRHARRWQDDPEGTAA